MRPGKAKVSEYPIAKKLGDEAVIARHYARTRVLIGAGVLTLVRGSEPRRQGGRAAEGADHDGELTALRRVRELRSAGEVAR